MIADCGSLLLIDADTCALFECDYLPRCCQLSRCDDNVVKCQFYSYPLIICADILEWNYTLFVTFEELFLVEVISIKRV